MTLRKIRSGRSSAHPVFSSESSLITTTNLLNRNLLYPWLDMTVIYILMQCHGMWFFPRSFLLFSSLVRSISLLKNQWTFWFPSAILVVPFRLEFSVEWYAYEMCSWKFYWVLHFFLRMNLESSNSKPRLHFRDMAALGLLSQRTRRPRWVGT